MYVVFNTHVNCYVLYIFKVHVMLSSYYQKKVFSNPKLLYLFYLFIYLFILSLMLTITEKILFTIKIAVKC